MDKRFKKAKINATTALISQLVATFCGIIIPRIMIEGFGSEVYGATTSIAQFLSYITLLKSGIGRAASAEFYQSLAQKDIDQTSRIYHAVKRFFTVIGIIFIIYSLLLAFFYYDIADVGNFTRQYIFAMVIAISIGKMAEYMGGVANNILLSADQRQYVVNYAITFSNILNVVMIIILVNSGCDILWVKLGSSMIFLLNPLIYAIYLKRKYKIKKTKERTQLKNRWAGLAQHTAYFVQNHTDVLLLTVCADLKAVAVYSIYNLICASMRNIVSALTGGMEAMFGNMIAKGEEKTLRSVYEKYKIILFVATLTLFGATAILIEPFAMIYTSGIEDANYSQPVFAVILTVATAINCLVLPCFNLPVAAGLLKESGVGAYGEAAINFALSLALIFWDPLIGVAIGTLVATLFKSVYYTVFSAKHVLHVKVWPMLIKLFASLGILAAVSVFGTMLIKYIPTYNYQRWITAGFLTVCVTGTVSVFTGAILYPKGMKSVFSPVIKRFLRSK